MNTMTEERLQHTTQRILARGGASVERLKVLKNSAWALGYGGHGLSEELSGAGNQTSKAPSSPPLSCTSSPLLSTYVIFAKSFSKRAFVHSSGGMLPWPAVLSGAKKGSFICSYARLSISLSKPTSSTKSDRGSASKLTRGSQSGTNIKNRVSWRLQPGMSVCWEVLS